MLSSLSFTPDAPGDYYVMVSGYAFDPLPADPMDSGSGAGGADTGAYRVSIASRSRDTDHYAVRLRPGDVLGAARRARRPAFTVRTSPTGSA